MIAGSQFFVIDGYDLTPDLGDLTATLDAEVKPAKYYRGLTDTDSTPVVVVNEAGAQSVKFDAKGRLTAAQVDLAAAQAALDAGGCKALYGYGRNPGDRCIIAPAVQGAVSWGGQVGDIIPFASAVGGSGVFARGVLYAFAKITASPANFPASVGAVASGKSLVLRVHVVGVSGTAPALGLIYETSLLGDYSDAITRATFASFTATGVQEIVVAGPISDAGRFSVVSLAGSASPFFIVRAAAGIQ